MYAVFRAGGKQYRAAKGDILRLEKIDADEGATVKFDEVLLVGEGSDVKVGCLLTAGSEATVNGLLAVSTVLAAAPPQHALYTLSTHQHLCRRHRLTWYQ